MAWEKASILSRRQCGFHGQNVADQLSVAWKYLSVPSPQKIDYRKTSNISRTLVGNKIVDNSDVVRASPVGAAPTTSSFST